MRDVILDEATTARFDDIKERVALRDRSGRTLGFFLPLIPEPRPYPRWLHEEADAQITPEELARRSREVRARGGLTTAEVRDHLKGL